MLTAMLGAVAAVRDMRQVTAPHTRLCAGFGVAWERAISPEQQIGMLQSDGPGICLQRPSHGGSAMCPSGPSPTLTVACSVICGNRPVAWPVWAGSCVLHGGAWYMLDKDFFTRPFFRHLAAQGHVVMDVAYRLYPETDMLGMVGDAKRAIAWMKAQGPAYGVNPERVVVAGGSAGGYLALLAAYTPRRCTDTARRRGRDRSECRSGHLLLRPDGFTGLLRLHAAEHMGPPRLGNGGSPSPSLG